MQLHDDAIVGLYIENYYLVSASKDCTVKVWKYESFSKREDMKQVTKRFIYLFIFNTFLKVGKLLQTNKYQLTPGELDNINNNI